MRVFLSKWNDKDGYNWSREEWLDSNVLTDWLHQATQSGKKWNKKLIWKMPDCRTSRNGCTIWQCKMGATYTYTSWCIFYLCINLVHRIKRESKHDYMYWHEKAATAPKKLKVISVGLKTYGDDLLGFRAYCIDLFTDKNISITQQYYASILTQLKDNVKKKQSKIDKRCWSFPPQCVLVATLHSIGFDILSHPPHSPELNGDFLFPKLKKSFVGRNLQALKKSRM